MEFIETAEFTSRINAYQCEEEYRELQMKLAEHPGLGDVIQGTGGLRKIRMKTKSRGARGGLRVIYLYFVGNNGVFMVTCYQKAKQERLTSEQKKHLKAVAEAIKSHLGKKKG